MQTSSIIGPGCYVRGRSGWFRYRTLTAITLDWQAVNTAKLAGGPLSPADRDRWLKTGGYRTFYDWHTAISCYTSR